MELVKQKRVERGYSCKAMAMKLKISKTYYWQLENDRRRISYDMAVRIAKIFNLKPDDLFYEETKSKV